VQSRFVAKKRLKSGKWDPNAPEVVVRGQELKLRFAARCCLKYALFSRDLEAGWVGMEFGTHISRFDRAGFAVV
jgi:hypothetical protein